MSDTTALAIPGKKPSEVVAEATEQANVLMSVVQKANLARKIGDKNYLQVEAWQTIARFNNCLIDVVWSRPLAEGGQKVGYEARAELVRIADGVHLIGAEAECRFDEELETRDGQTFARWEDDYAVRSMAQTRAQAKVGRMAYAWVAVLAGFAGTPAEEMKDGAKRGVVFPFGKHKDKPPADLSAEDLHKELDFWQKKVAEEKNPRFKANNERLVAAIQAALAEKTAKAESPAASNIQQEGTDTQRVGPQPAAGDLPPLEQAWAQVKELCEAKGWSKEKVVNWCRQTHGVGPKELDLLRVQGLVAHLREQPDEKQGQLV